jgi:tellurite resistance protein
MSIFGAMKNAFKAGNREISAAYKENLDFLEAVCSAVALTANADGSIDESEKRKAQSVVLNHSQLSKLYSAQQIETTLETMFKRSKDASGRQSLARELDDIKGRPNAKQMSEDVYLIAVDIANADGTVSDEEKAILAKIASRLGVNPSDFEF